MKHRIHECHERKDKRFFGVAAGQAGLQLLVCVGGAGLHVVHQVTTGGYADPGTVGYNQQRVKVRGKEERV
jgi:hypothetical protein